MIGSAMWRSELYTFLALALRPPDDSWPAMVEGLASALRRAGWSAEELEKLRAHDERGLHQAHDRLFGRAGQALAHPYESVYGEGRVMGQAAVAVGQLYAQEGLTPAEREMPDHVTLELEYMAYLADRQAQATDENQARIYRDKQDAFLKEHLVQWVPLFCARLTAADEHPFYTALGQVLESYICLELIEVQNRLDPARSEESNPAQLEVDQRACTLCGLCVETCPEKALALVVTEREASLIHQSSLCRGCGRCRESCPEQVITIEPLTEPATSRLLAHSKRAICPRCGSPHVPQACLERILDRIGGDKKALVQRLQLCPTCKTSRLSQYY